MSITIQANGQGRVNQNAARSNGLENEEVKKQGRGQKKKESAKNIFAGDLNLVEDPIAKKRKEAQQKALKIVQEAWGRDRDVEDSIQERRDSYNKMEKLREEAQSVVKDLEGNKAALREEYSIDMDSQEQKDLELLERDQNRRSGLEENFTEEEEKRLGELMTEPRTEYQERALEINKQEIKFKKDIQSAENGMRTELANIRSIELEKLKSDPMVDAQKSAEKILEAASKEIAGMLKDEAVDHIDEELEKKEEEAKEEAEKKEEKEERQEEIEVKRAIQEALIAKTKESVEEAEAAQKKRDMPDVSIEETIELSKPNAQTQDVQKKLNDLKSSMNVLEADLKGIQIDEGV